MTQIKGIPRRSFLAGTAATLALAGAVGFNRTAFAASSLQKITVTQAVTSLAFIQNYLASELGYFKDEGLDVEIVVTRGGGPDVQAVISGDAAFTVNDGAQVLPAVARGLDLKCIMATLDKNIINVSMVKETADRLNLTPESPIEQKLAALKGLKIGVTRPGSLTWQLARFNLLKAGLNPDTDATIVGVGGGPAVAAALDNKDVDVIYISVPLGERVVNSGNAITLIDNSNGQDPNLPSFMMEGLWATPEYMASNPETCKAMVSALSKASKFILENDAKTISEPLKPVFGALGDDVLQIGAGMVKAAVSSSGEFSQETLDVTQNVLTSNKSIERTMTLNEVFDGQFLTS
ncbi:ABC transporter substrate-binding protein [Sneathiella litorea]|uniref:PhnD/SsuA/transferrin family substrate-binding protein n=1 Tax=Sneathiella litorea TaxID=2606216 RepID=A0A6L8WAD4_9PROT|nr:ABC transporter substrate-binding protein [Sneathiella litorea]MZR31604.1 PhnD/SsuA/transferrin family substrate-binding protein [Sneathiella litorea]